MNRIAPHHPTRRHGVLAALALVVSLGAAACGDDDDTDAGAETTEATAAAADAPTTQAPASEAPATEVTDTPSTDAAGGGGGGELTISDFTFGDVSAPAGSEITLTNADDFAHTVTDDGGAFDVRVEGSSTAPLVIDTAGTYAIFCKIHPSMQGTITVE